MRHRSIIAFLLISFFSLQGCQESKPVDETTNESTTQTAEKAHGPITLVIHGGAGNITRERITPEMDSLYRQKLAEALEVGYALLEEGKPAMDAVIASIQIMEASPLFNAGVGAVFTAEGTNELDASVMDGATRNAGAVAGVKTIKSPIEAARAVMEQSPHVMLTGPGAEQFAQEAGLEIVDPQYFFTEKRYQSLMKIKAAEEKEPLSFMKKYPDYKFGTVGCVALDKEGNIAAGTSTGGMTNKKYGRVGDAPIIAAGTYADNATCGVSATGHGEYFIRSVVAYDIAAKMKYLNMSLEEASSQVVDKELVEFGGSGGIIALDRQGNVSMPFNSSGMFRGYKKQGSKIHTALFDDEK